MKTYLYEDEFLRICEDDVRNLDPKKWIVQHLKGFRLEAEVELICKHYNLKTEITR